MVLRRGEALRSLQGPFVLGPGSALRKGKRVFPLGDESGMIARLDPEGARSMSAAQARVSHMVRDFRTDLGFILQRAQNNARGAAIRALLASHAWPARARMATDSFLRGAWIRPGLLLAGLSGPVRAGRAPVCAALRVQLASGAGERGVVRAFRPGGRQGRGSEGTCRGSRRALTPAATG